MKRITLLLLTLLAAGWSAAFAAPAATSPAAENRVLLIDPSSMPLPAARATLIIGPLTRTNGVYVGDFKLKVLPFFFKNDRGRLVINVPDAALAAINQGRTVAITGTSTSTRNGIVRHIVITATPADRNHGMVRLWFLVDSRKMIFTPAYHFAGPSPAAVPVLTPPPDPATSRPGSHSGAAESAG